MTSTNTVGRNMLALICAPQTAGRLCLALVLALLLAVGAQITADGMAGPVFADPIWSAPVALYSTTSFAAEPRLVPDAAGNLHLLFTTSTDAVPTPASPGALEYMTFSNGRWSTPVEILTTPGGRGVAQPSLSVGQTGTLHVIWKGETSSGSSLYYSSAPANSALSAQSWRTPQVLGDALATGPFGGPAAVATGAEDQVYVVYASKDRRLHFRVSRDSGVNWSVDSVIMEPSSNTVSADLPFLVVDGRGWLQLTWTELQNPTGWPPTGALHSSSSDAGQTWSTPVRLTGQGFGLLDAVPGRGQTIYFLWNSIIQIGERRFVASDDGGITTIQPDTVIPLPRPGGFSGYPSGAVDSAGVLHIVTSLLGQPGGPAALIYYTHLGAAGWSKATFVSLGAVGASQVEQPGIAITQGNRLNVVYEDDAKRIWYTSALADAPTIAPTGFTTPVTSQGVPATWARQPDKIVRSTPTEAPPHTSFTPSPLPDNRAALHFSQTEISPLIFAALASVLLLSAVIVVRQHRAT